MAAANNDFCNIIQDSLIKHVANTETRITQKGFLDALVSPINKPITPTVDAITRNTSKNLTVRMRYWQGLAEGAAQSGVADVCVIGTPRTPFSQDYDITLAASMKVAVSTDAFRNYCENKDVRLNVELMDAMDKVLKQKSDLLAAKAATYALYSATSLRAGVGVDTVITPITAPFFTGAALNPYGVLSVLNEFEEADVTEAPILIGWNRLKNYAHLAQIACCNDDGFDVAKMGDGFGGDFSYFKDRRLPAILGGPERFLALRPGWMQHFSMPKYEGQFATMKDKYVYNDVMVDPRTGEKFDIQSRMDECDLDVINLVVSQHFDLFVVPSDLYDPADPLSGYRGAVVFNATA